MPGLVSFLPALQLPGFVCRNCGFWQRNFATPADCPLCKDARHVLPVNGWAFYSQAEASSTFPMHWEELLPGLWRFWNNPVEGIGSHSYLIEHPLGNVVFEGATVYSKEALEKMAELGGVQFVSASHPHTYGALWQLQDYFDARIALHTGDFGWAGALRVTHPFDMKLDLHPNLRLLHAGVHFEGQSFLYDESRSILFCGDALKFDLDPSDVRRAVSISSHKSFVRSVPITPREIRQYRRVFRSCSFDKIYSPFEQVHNVGSKMVDNFLQRIHEEYPQSQFVKINSLE